MTVEAACRCLEDIGFFMTPHTHDESEPGRCPRCGELQFPTDYYCWACGKQLDYGAVVK